MSEVSTVPGMVLQHIKKAGVYEYGLVYYVENDSLPIEHILTVNSHNEVVLGASRYADPSDIYRKYISPTNVNLRRLIKTGRCNNEPVWESPLWPTNRMTLREVEEALGYHVEIVKDPGDE